MPTLKSAGVKFPQSESKQRSKSKTSNKNPNWRQDALKSIYIWRLPLYVTVVLKRFSPDGRKLHAPVKLEGDVSFDGLFSTESPERVGNQKYALQSIVDHHGGASGGHYTAQCRSKDGAWHLYDDESVHDIAGPMLGSFTYMIWFRRVG